MGASCPGLAAARFRLRLSTDGSFPGMSMITDNDDGNRRPKLRVWLIFSGAEYFEN